MFLNIKSYINYYIYVLYGFDTCFMWTVHKTQSVLGTIKITIFVVPKHSTVSVNRCPKHTINQYNNSSTFYSVQKRRVCENRAIIAAVFI